MERKELRAISLLLRALLVLIGLACLWQLRLELYTVRFSYSMMLDPMDPTASVYRRSFVCGLLISLSALAVFPGLAVLWDIFRPVGLGRGFDEGAARRLRRMGRCGEVVTALLALLVWVMLYDRADRVGEGMNVLQGLYYRLDFYVVAILGLTLAAAIGTAVFFLLSRLAEKAADEQAVHDLTI